mmetsp:Transcript_39379/g.67567  ORF Transcript_39379/g.67567 Transcript_39379/m.67567 type:complete len:326 (-) Transcript_39379:77-1054(-)
MKRILSTLFRRNRQGTQRNEVQEPELQGFEISIFNACRDGNEEEFLHVLEENPQFNLNKIFPNPEIRGGYMVDVIYGENLVNVACRNNQYKMVLLLGERGANLNVSAPTTPLLVACRSNDVEFVQQLLNFEQVNPNVGDGEHPLQIACKNGNVEIVKLLLECEEINVNLSMSYDDDVSPLYYAIQKGNLKIVRMLLDTKGIDVNFGWRGFEGRADSTLALACTKSLEIVEMLLEFDNIKFWCGDEEPPIIYACKTRNIELLSLLLEKYKEVLCFDVSTVLGPKDAVDDATIKIFTILVNYGYEIPSSHEKLLSALKGASKKSARK